MISRAVAAWTSANQTAVICGPALGGLIYALSPVLVGVICLAFFACSITLISFVRAKGRRRQRASRRHSLPFSPASTTSAAGAVCSA